MRHAEKDRLIATANREDLRWFRANPQQTLRVRDYVEGEFIEHNTAYTRTLVFRGPGGIIIKHPYSPTIDNPAKVHFNQVTGQIELITFVEEKE